ncbi:MAG: glycosyltransferase family 39 protein [Proteobacteria bacterium]|nr:glycosyltransferase family 39 protein [Pseudomonadota bacterium]
MPDHASRLPPRPVLMVLLLGALVLGGAARLRGAEYDEQYSRFLLAGDARPAWPVGAFTAAEGRQRFAGAAAPAGIAADLRRTDVHPPLYFWLAAGWRALVGDGLLRLRLFSVLCSLGALGAAGLIARRAAIPPALSMLLTLGCYAFAYTGAVARGFALAQLLALLGVLAALRREPAGTRFGAALAGSLLGAAAFTNYLAAFLAVPAVLWLAARRLSHGILAALAALPFAAADLWFLAAQHASRPDQFQPFALAHAAARLAALGAASLAGGLPLYAPPALSGAVAALCGGLVAAAALLVAARFRRIGAARPRLLLAGLAAAPPLGLLLLGAVSGNTPIELRYLAFATPYAALLLAGALASLPRPAFAACAATALAVQAAAIAGLLLRPETMQPMRQAARQAAALAAADPGDPPLVLLPRGNDGVGIVGAFVSEAPAATRILLIDAATRPEALRPLASRLALVRLDRDAESSAAVTALWARLAADPCWRARQGSSRIELFENGCGSGGWTSTTAAR